MRRKTVLVVEDDAAIRRGVVDALKFAGYDVIEAADGARGLATALESRPDLVLLDLLLPRKDGFDVLAELRESDRATPVIILTARGAESDRVRGLKTGADDYVVKPFSATELLARVEAVLRRSAERPKGLKTRTVAGRTIDFERREVKLPGGASAELSERECALLRHLCENSARAVSREELLRHVWGIEPSGLETRTVDMLVARLREKLGDSSEKGEVIATVRGSGYRLG